MATTTSNAVQLIIGGRVQSGIIGGLENLNKKLAALGSMATQVGGALAGLFAVQRLASFTSAAIHAADAIGKLAEKTGIGVDALGQLIHVAAQDDIELGTLQTALKGLSVWLVKAGQSGKPLEQALLDQATAFASMEDGAEKAALAVQIFGRSGMDMLPFLKRGPEGIRALMEEARRLGAVTADQAKQADAWGDSLGNATLAAQGLARSLAGPLLDAMTPLVTQMAELIGSLSRFVRESPLVKSAILAVAQALTVLTTALIASTVASKAFSVSVGVGAVRSLKDFIAYLQLLPALIRGSTLLRLAGWIGVVTEALTAGVEAWKLWRAQTQLAQQTADQAGTNFTNIKEIQRLIELRAAEGKLTAAQAQQYRELAAAIREDISQSKLDVATTTQLVAELAAKIQQTISGPTSGQDAYLKYMASLRKQFEDTAGLDHYLQGLEKATGLEEERVRHQIASLEMAIKEATTDERRLQLMQAQLAFADDLVASAQQRLDKAKLAEVSLETLLKLEQELLKAENERFDISKRILDIQEQTRTAAKQAAVDAAAARAERLAQGREVIGSTFAGQAAKGFRDFREQQEAEEGAGVGGLGPGAIAGLQNAMVQLGTAAQQVGQAISTFIGGAVQGIAGAIEGLIRRTMTWKDALYAVGTAILDSIIGAISQMLAQMLVGFLLQQLFGRLMEAQARELAGSWAPAAFFAAVATEGTAVAIGLGSLSSGLAAMQGLGQFMQGGFTGPGPKDRPAGIVHAGEYVIPQKTVNEMGIHHFDALVAGHGAGTAPAPTRSLNQNLHLYFDRRAWMQATRDDIESVALDVMRRNGWRTQLG